MTKPLRTLLCLSLIIWWQSSSAEETGKDPNPPSSELLPDPASIDMADTAKAGLFSIGIFSCVNKETPSGKVNIVCFNVVTLDKYEQYDFTVKKATKWKPRLIDNLGIEHKFIALYFLDRRGHQQEEVNLSKGESVWLATEFANGGEKGITDARVIYTNLPNHPQLRTPVKPVE
jgi:hypothetical protein